MRLYAIADYDFIYPKLSELGISLMANARMSIDGSKIIRCINHTPKRMQLIFKKGTDVGGVLSNCRILNVVQAEKEMSLPEWSEPDDPGAMA